MIEKCSESFFLFQDEYDDLAGDIANSKPEKDPPNVELTAGDFIVDVTILPEQAALILLSCTQTLLCVVPGLKVWGGGRCSLATQTNDGLPNRC